MISFYLERQPDELLLVTFFTGDGKECGKCCDVEETNIDATINGFFTELDKTQIFEKPNEL